MLRSMLDRSSLTALAVCRVLLCSCSCLSLRRSSSTSFMSSLTASTSLKNLSRLRFPSTAVVGPVISVSRGEEEEPKRDKGPERSMAVQLDKAMGFLK
ncbi:hypothetical protein V2J09_018598 [Rumex salicifolius]